MHHAAVPWKGVERMAEPEVAILVSSFERPRHLQRVLWSIARQHLPGGSSLGEQVEVVVTDDGSSDDSRQVAARFARQVPFPVRWTTHRHEGFQLARCRNEGVAASSAPYLLFLDGDCLMPQGHLAAHWQRRRMGWAQAGYCGLLDKATSQSLTVEAIQRGDHDRILPTRELRKLRTMHRKGEIYRWLRHPHKPKLYGGNIGIHRQDYLRVNGYDEAFRGWGCEDDDLRLRLREAGVRVRSILDRTWTVHLWHPPTPSAPGRWSDGANVERLRRRNRPVLCAAGVDQYLTGNRPVEQIALNGAALCRGGESSVPGARNRGGQNRGARVEVPGSSRQGGRC